MMQIIPGIEGFPLGTATKLRCADPALAEQTVGNLVEPRRLIMRGRAADIRISHVALNFGHLFGVSHGAAILATSGPITSYQVMVPLRGTLVGHTRHGKLVTDAGNALVYSPRDCLDTCWSEDCIGLVLSVPAERLRTLARAAGPGTNTEVISLKPQMILTQGSGRSFANALGTICQESVDPDSAFSRGVTGRALEQSLLLSLLLAQQEGGPPPFPAASHSRHTYVARALAFIDANCADDIGLADLTRVTGVSVRTLQYSFMERFGVGPTAYLRQTRLRRIRDALHAAQPGTCTVGDVAARWGFYNGSSFARAYHKLFGELPSQTLAART